MAQGFPRPIQVPRPFESNGLQLGRLNLRFELPRVFLPKPKYAVSGPGGVEASFDWRAAYDDSEGTMLRAHLLNDVTSYT